MTTISLPFGAVRMEQFKANEPAYIITSDCSAATVSGESLSLKELRGQLYISPGRGGDKCRGHIDLTLRDESKGVDDKYRVELAPDFFSLTIRKRLKSEAVEIKRVSQEGGYGKPQVFTMDMTITLQRI